MRAHILYSIVLFSLSALSAAHADVETDIAKIQEVCNKSIENRLKIKQWHVKLDAVNTGRYKDDLPIAYSFYVDGNRKREDKTFPTPDEKTKEQFCIQNDEFYFVYLKHDNQIDPTLAMYQVETKSRYAPKDAFKLD